MSISHESITNYKIYYLTQAQYDTLITTGNITVDGQTIQYDPTAEYRTPDLRGVPSGVAELDANGKVPVSQCPIEEDVAQATTDWLDEHIMQETGYVLDNSLTVAGAAADAKAVGDLKSAINATAVELSPLYVSASYPTGNIGETISFTSSTNWRRSALDVIGGKAYLFEVVTYKNTVYCVYFVDSAEKILAKYAVGSASNAPETIEYVNVIAPANAVKVYLMKHSSTQRDVCKAWIYNSPVTTQISILTINCDRFVAVDGSTSLEVYKNRWRIMFNDNPFDIVGLTDYQQKFGNGSDIPAENTLFADTLRMPLQSISEGVGLSCGIKNGLLTFYERIDVGQSETRHIVAHYKYLINDILVDIFLGHFQPDQNKASNRAIQFANIINEMSKYQNVILMGDFNAWTESEYDVFKQNGYKIANGGYLPIQNTLRDIPADNIVYSSNFVLKSFRVLNDYDLNTDHYPIYASLSIN